MENLEFSEPVSPSGRYFNTTLLCAYVFGFLESEIPIDDSQTMYLFKDVFLPINPRFSSIMVRDEDGEMRWKKVEVKAEEHIKVPIFPKNESSQFYDEYFDEYVSRILMEKTPQDKPLWEVHVIKYPTTSAKGTLIFKFHHALGDGYTLVGALLSCLQRADDPSLPLTFPSRRPNESAVRAKKGFFRRIPSAVFSVFNSISDFGWSVVKSSMVEDDKSPIRSGEEGVENQPCVLTNISFSLDHIKKIKSMLGVTLNDVITGAIFYGLRLYMEEMNSEKGRRTKSTGLVLLSTRNIGSYQSIQEMMKPNSRSPWGNHIAFLHVSIPKLTQSSLSNPLEFVWKAQKIIKRKRNSFTVFLIEWLLDLELKLRGHEAVAKHIYGTLKNASVVISNLIGPVEPMALANHPCKGLYFTMTGGPESINIAIMSYTRTLRVTLKTQKGFIDEKLFKSCMVNAFEAISKAAMEMPRSKG